MTQLLQFPAPPQCRLDSSRLKQRMNEVVIETCDALDRMERLLIELQIEVSRLAASEGKAHEDAIAPLVALTAAFRANLGSGWTAEHRAMAIAANVFAMELRASRDADCESSEAK